MKYSVKSLAILIVTFFAAACMQSCKENTLINSKVSPASNTVGVYDTLLPVFTHTYYDDTAITSLYLGLSIYQGVGSMVDPFFGTVAGATNFQVLPTNPTGAIYDNKTIDSAVVVLPYTGLTYGDTADQTQTQTYQVFYLQDTMNITSTYYSFTQKPIDAASPLSAPTTVNLYHLKDSLSVNGVNYNPGLRIRLNLPVLLSHLMPAINGITNSSAPTADFLNAFHGICIKAADTRVTAKAFPYFQLDGTSDYSGAGILVYYHTNGNPADSFHERYYFNPTYCAFYNGINKSYSRYPVNQLITSVQANDSIVGLQNQPGANIDVVIPGLKNLPKGIINKAELQLVMLPGYDQDVYIAPSRLYPRGIGNGVYPTGITAGLTYNVADRYPLTSTSPFTILDGQMHSITRQGTAVNAFTIGIPREIMSSIAAKNDTVHLHVTGTQDYYGAFHLIAGGGGHPNPVYQAKLFVVYSLLQK